MGVEKNTIDKYIAEMIGSDQKSNHLLAEKSPYLLQHAFNPVDWFPWGIEALEKAIKEDKPIFISIGYSTCHWCHVMAHESFEDSAVAQSLNKHFVSIKIDREERPDLDQVYMAVTQAMTGSGGWPMSLFLTPDLKPFFSGTYFPPTSNFGRAGFLDIVNSIGKAWEQNKDKVVSQAEDVLKRLEPIFTNNTKTVALDSKEVSQKAYNHYKNTYDHQYGGFGGAPKFARPVSLYFLLNYREHFGDKHAEEMVFKTLTKMGNGGVYDQLGGGFHRYAVDQHWHVPHFEKMLYDQALSATAYADAYLLNNDKFFKKISCETLNYVIREMLDESGGFYSAEDADSVSPENPDQKGEGAYYLWRYSELEEILEKDELLIFSYTYGAVKDGNVAEDPQEEFVGKNIFYQYCSHEEVAAKFNKTENEIVNILSEAKKKLLEIRETRPLPHLDDKILASWNALMISSFIRGYKVFGEDKYLEVAEQAANFILNEMFDGEGNLLLRRFRQGEAGVAGNLEDYAFVIQCLIDLYEATKDGKWLTEAEKITKLQIKYFTDPKTDNFFDAYDRSIIIKDGLKNDYDGVEPSGNSVSALNFLRLGKLLSDKNYTDIGKKVIKSFSANLAENPFYLPYMVIALNFDDLCC